MADSSETKQLRLVGRNKQLNLLRECRDKMKEKKNGSMIVVSADSGYGTTSLLKSFEQENSSVTSGVVFAYADCQAPVGNFHIGSLQPLYPFVRMMEVLAEREKKSDEKRLAINIGISLLTTIPFAGDFFYAAKEIHRDVHDYIRKKKDTDQIAAPQGNLISDMYGFIVEYAKKRPLVVLLDAMHFADAQSVELLGKLYDAIATLPLMIVIGYSPSISNTVVSPLLQFIKRFTPDKNNFLKIELPAFTPDELSECCKMQLPEYTQNQQFERWIAERTSGIPSLVAEYLRYFQQYPPFAPDGSIRQDIISTDILPASIHAAFSKLVEQLSDDDRAILSLCSIEGMESTVSIMSSLLNLDALTTVRKLRSLQRRTGIIRSAGTKHRYGIKTTVYEFSQEFYYEYFRDSLEYEEGVALHRQVASLLDKALKDIADPLERLAISPYLAAHNSEAGDEEAARKILEETARNAEKTGDDVLAHEIFSRYQSILTHKPDADEEEFMEMVHGDQKVQTENILDNSSNAPDDAIAEENIPIDFPAMQREVIGLLIAGQYSDASDKSRHYADFYRQRLLPEERAVLLILTARAHIGLNDLEDAGRWCRKAMDMLRSFPDAQAECLAYNTLALLHVNDNDDEAAWNELRRAAKISSTIGQEYQLLTVSNIGNLLRRLNPKKSLPYLALAKRMCRSLNFRAFMEEFLI